jgi:hypothetical protein
MLTTEPRAERGWPATIEPMEWLKILDPDPMEWQWLEMLDPDLGHGCLSPGNG